MTRIASALIAGVVLAVVASAQQAPPVAVLGVPEEIAPLEQRLAERETQRIGATTIVTGTLDGRRVVIGRSGIGKVNAATAATIVLDRFRPSALMFSGTAGALDPTLGPCDVVIATRVAQHDIGRLTAEGFVRRPTRDSVTGEPNPMFFEAPDALLTAARAAATAVTFPPAPLPNGTRQPRVHEAAIISGDVFVADPKQRDDLRAFGGAAVEMEGAAMVQVCRQFATPCLVVRGITDAADGSATLNYQTYLKPASENAATIVAATIARLSK